LRQFDVCENPSPRSRAYAPFVVILQSHLLDAAPTCVVAPLLNAEGRRAYTEVSAEVVFQEKAYIVSIAELAAIERRLLDGPVGSLLAFEDGIRRAMDRLFTGF